MSTGGDAVPTTTYNYSHKEALDNREIHHDNDDTSVYSQLTGSTMTFARPAHVRVVRKVPVNEGR